jgi:hypothetical protein
LPPRPFGDEGGTDTQNRAKRCACQSPPVHGLMVEAGGTPAQRA